MICRQEMLQTIRDDISPCDCVNVQSNRVKVDASTFVFCVFIIGLRMDRFDIEDILKALEEVGHKKRFSQLSTTGKLSDQSA